LEPEDRLREAATWRFLDTQYLVERVRSLALGDTAVVPPLWRSRPSAEPQSSFPTRRGGSTGGTGSPTLGGVLDQAGDPSVVWAPDERRLAPVDTDYLGRQASCIGGGTAEMARNVISERLLRMVRETRADGGPFRDVARGPR
jgi:hypothetical protein